MRILLYNNGQNLRNMQEDFFLNGEKKQGL